MLSTLLVVGVISHLWCAARLVGIAHHSFYSVRAKNATYKYLATSLEMVATIGEFIDAKTVSELPNSSFLSLMADEATDLRNRTVCMFVLPYYCWLY